MSKSKCEIKGLHEYLDEALVEYSKGEYYHNLVNAKEDFIKQVGKVNEDESHYEQQMSFFNEWYLYNYVIPFKTKTPIDLYLENFSPEINLKDVHFSVFEYTKNNFRKEKVLVDLVDSKKYFLKPDYQVVNLLKDDIFIAGIYQEQRHSILTRGVFVLSQEATGLIKKQAKKMYKLSGHSRTHLFLKKLIELQNKFIKYKHLSVEKVYIF